MSTRRRRPRPPGKSSAIISSKFRAVASSLSSKAAVISLTHSLNADLDEDGLADLEEEALLRQFRPVWDFDESETLFPISLAEWAGLGERISPEPAA